MTDFTDEFTDFLDALRAEPAMESGPFARLRSAITRSPRPGDVIGQFYVIEECLSPSVFKVRHSRLDRVFALRLQAEEGPSGSFREAALAASSVGHENIVYVTHFAHSKRLGQYYVMEYLDGATLADQLHDRTFASAEAQAMAVEIGSALAAAHDLGLVHGALSPKRIMTHEGLWKLLEFAPGEARGQADPLYVAPEIADGAAYGGFSDQFSLAAILWEALTGAPPWADRTWASAGSADYLQPPAAPALRGMMAGTLLRALKVDPAQRFRSVEEFVAVLHRSLGRPHRATMPPLDVADAWQRPAARAASVEVGAEFIPGELDADQATQPSVEVAVAQLPNMRMRVSMVFNTSSRLRREWRRNMVGGSVFVPTTRRLNPGSPLTLALRYAPTGAEASFPARVGELVTEPQGLAVEIAEEVLEVFQAFVQELQVDVLEPTALVTLIRAPTPELTPDEAFVASLLPEPSSVGKLRSMLGNLPLEIDEVLSSLEQSDFVRIEGAGRRSRRTRQAALDPEEMVGVALQRADYFRGTGNIHAELETLKIAADRYESAPCFYRYALTKIQFLNDMEGALHALERAVALAPADARYTRALEDLQRFAGAR